MPTHARLWNSFWCGSFAALVVLGTAVPLAAQQPKLLGTLGSKDKGPFTTIAFSSDGKRLACSWLHKIAVYEIGSGKLIADFDAHRPGTRGVAVAYRPDGKILASVDTDPNGRIKFWDATTHDKIREMQGSLFLAFSPDSKVLASAGDNAAGVQLWNAETGKKLASLQGLNRPVWTLAFSPDGRTLATVRKNDFVVTLWDVASGKETRTVDAKIRPYCLAFSPDGKTLACGGHEDKDYFLDKIVLWDLAAGKENTLLKGPVGKPGSGVTGMVYTPDGKTLITVTGRQIALRHPTTGRVAALLEGPNLGFDTGANAITLSPDGRTLAATGTQVRLWSLSAARKK